MRSEMGKAPAACNDRGPEEQTTDSTAIVADRAAADKLFSTLQAEGALQGYEVIFLPDGRCLACHWGWCKLLRNLRDLAQFLGKGWIN